MAKSDTVSAHARAHTHTHRDTDTHTHTHIKEEGAEREGAREWAMVVRILEAVRINRILPI